MKNNYLFKSIPLLSTLIVLILLNISNQKEYTKLKLLIWDTPNLPIGTYLSISTGTGFLLSYIITFNIAKINNTIQKNSIEYKFKKRTDYNSRMEDKNIEKMYENTLIERDINDPSPTIKANFRVIGKTNRMNQSIDKNELDENEYLNNSFLSNDNLYTEDNNINYDQNQVKNDWDDDSYSNW